jgi:hypothetical protein
LPDFVKQAFVFVASRDNPNQGLSGAVFSGIGSQASVDDLGGAGFSIDGQPATGWYYIANNNESFDIWQVQVAVPGYATGSFNGEFMTKTSETFSGNDKNVTTSGYFQMLLWTPQEEEALQEIIEALEAAAAAGW